MHLEVSDFINIKSYDDYIFAILVYIKMQNYYLLKTLFKIKKFKNYEKILQNNLWHPYYLNVKQEVINKALQSGNKIIFETIKNIFDIRADPISIQRPMTELFYDENKNTFVHITSCSKYCLEMSETLYNFENIVGSTQLLYNAAKSEKDFGKLTTHLSRFPPDINQTVRKISEEYAQFIDYIFDNIIKSICVDTKNKPNSDEDAYFTLYERIGREPSKWEISLLMDKVKNSSPVLI